MNIQLKLISFILSSCFFTSSIVRSEEVQITAQDIAQVYQKPPDEYFKYVKRKVEVDPNTMPRLRSQDTIGNCVACTTTTMVQQHICKNMKFPVEMTDPVDKTKKTVVSNCGELPPYAEVSLLTPFAKGFSNPLNSQDVVDKLEDGFYTFDAIELVRKEQTLISEACYSFDKVANIHSEDPKKVRESIAQLEKFWKNRKTYLEADSDCTECKAAAEAASVMFGLNIQQDRVKILAKNADNIKEFVTSLLISKKNNPQHEYCMKEIKFNNFTKSIAFPNQENIKAKTPLTTEEILDKLYTNFDKNIPVGLGSVCLVKKGNTCKATHAFVISGYAELCRDKELKDCKKVFKFQDCAGKDFAALFRDNYILAEPLLNSIKKIKDIEGVLPAGLNKDSLVPGSFSWYE